MKEKRVTDVIKSIPCPNHGTPIALIEQGNKVIAICTCDVKPNKHAGQIVYEGSLEPKEQN